MDDFDAVAWLHRRAGFGLHPDDLATAAEDGPGAELARLTSPASIDDPWDGLDLDPEHDGRAEAVLAWVAHLAATDTPFQDRRTWLLHGWLVSSMAKVNAPDVMVEQIRLFMEQGGRRFPDLLAAVTVNPAMLVYLDGRTSTAAAPNENYGRELLELFGLGIGHYDEADVQAAARALTGWVVTRERTARFVPFRHDDTPRRLLGRDVDDVASVIAAVTNHPEHPRFVARRIAAEYLGDPGEPPVSDVVDELADAYVDADMQLDPTIDAALRFGLEGAASTLALAPIPWMTIALRATGVPPSALRRAEGQPVRDLGQLPLLPPDVSGWPTGTAWFTESSLVARTKVAMAVAGAVRPDQPVAEASVDGDVELLRRHLGIPTPFSTTTTAALLAEPDPVNRLALALVSPECLTA